MKKTKMSNQMTSFRGNENAGYQKMVSKTLQALCVCQSNKQIKVSHSKETRATQILLYDKDSRYPTYHQIQSYPPKCKQTFNSLTIPAELLTRPKILERAKHLLQIRWGQDCREETQLQDLASHLATRHGHLLRSIN